jgi:hypothetical protein
MLGRCDFGNGDDGGDGTGRERLDVGDVRKACG